MSRRGGLGRGLAALIPPAPRDDEARHDEQGAATTDARGESSGSADTRTDEPQQDGPAPTTDPAGRGRAEDAPPSGTQPGRAPADDLQTDGVSAGDLPAHATLLELPVSTIETNPRQPREIFDDAELAGLAVSLRDVGVLQPIVVRPRADGAYELIAGERRLRAAKLAGLATLPAVVRHTDDLDLLKEALVENIHRVQLNPLEEAAAYQQLLEEFGFTQEELARNLGRSRPAISNTIRLLSLPPDVQRRVAAGVLTAGHAKALLAVSSPQVQQRLADRIVREGLSVRATEEMVRLAAGDEPPPPRPARTGRRATAPGLVDLQDDLSNALQTRVRIQMGARKGRLTIEFTSVDDLERVVDVIATGIGAAGTGGASSLGPAASGASGPPAAAGQPNEAADDGPGSDAG